jgi:hypothetical protein
VVSGFLTSGIREVLSLDFRLRGHSVAVPDDLAVGIG